MPLEKHRLVLPGYCAQQVLVIHIPGSYLQYIHIFRHQVNLVLTPDLGQHWHIELPPGLPEPAQRFLGLVTAGGAQALEGVDGGPGFEDAAPEDMGAGLSGLLGRLHQLLAGLHGAGAGDEHRLTSAYLHVTNLNSIALALGGEVVVLPVDEFVGRLNHAGFLDAGQGGQVSKWYLKLVTHQADDGAELPPGDVRPQAVLFHFIYNVLYLLRFGVFLHYDHFLPLSYFAVRRPGKGQKKSSHRGGLTLRLFSGFVSFRSS